MIGALAAVLADQSVAVAESVDHVPARPRARRWSRCFPPPFCGARASRWRWPRSSARATGPGPARRARVRGEHGRRDRRRGAVQRRRHSALVGTQHGEQLLIAISLASAIVVFAAVRRARASQQRTNATRSARRLGAAPGADASSPSPVRRCDRVRDRGAQRSRRPRGLRALSSDVHEPAEVPLRRRRDELVDRRVGAAERRAQLPRRGQGRGVERAAGHAAAANARHICGAADDDAADRCSSSDSARA